MSNTRCSHIFLTGPPGCGKTTLIKNISQRLKSQQIPCDGFYTVEKRENGVRQGFDVVDINTEKSSRLAFITSGQREVKGPHVGRYSVDVESFESIIRPILSNQNPHRKVLIIDEIGKMESFSEYFKIMVRNAYKTASNVVILASIPIKKTELGYVEKLCQLPTAQIFTVNRGNRDTLVDLLSNQMIQSYRQMR